MSEKNMGRKFKVGDKVKLTKAGEYSDYFNADFNVGDTAEIVSMNNIVYEILVTSGHIEGHPQFIAIENMSEGWISHLSNKKTEKKRKHFRMGDFVILKDGVDTEKVTKYNDIDKGAIGLVFESVLENWVPVGYSTEEGDFDYDYVHSEALRLATKEERKALRKLKIAKITYDNISEQTIEEETEIPPEYNVKIGDYVKITENADGHPVGTVGFVIEIEEVPEGYYNHVVVSDFDDNCWNEHNVKLVHRATLTCEDEDSSESNSAVTPATDENKLVMLGDILINRYSKSVYTVILIDDIFETEFPYYITSKNESTWISEGTVAQDYTKLLEDGRVYDWTTDTTFTNVESWISSTK